MRARRAALAALAALACVTAAAPAAAHRLAPALLALDEAADGRFEVVFKTPLDRGATPELAPELPPHCAPATETTRTVDMASVRLHWRVDCGAAGVVGARLGVRGLAESEGNALLRVALLDGRRLQAVLHAGEASYVVPERASALDVFADYLRLGALHIAGGVDHLLFVFGLLLLVSGVRSLVATVTAFTLGHSVTLSVAALGWVRVPSAPVELLIALTILVLALELARGADAPPSALRRRPWAMAFGFGLLHGFGFAGALAEVGLPQQEIPLALFSFNGGIEIGQLAFVAVVLVARALFAPLLARAPESLLRAPVTAMGALAVFWCLDRGASLLR